MIRRADLVCLANVLAVSALWAPRLRGPIDLRWDGGAYYISGTSMARGEGYRLLNEAGEIRAIQYPPPLPALVAAHQHAVGNDDPAVVGWRLRLTYCALTGDYILATYALARSFLGPPRALIVALMTEPHFFTIWFSDQPSTEIPHALSIRMSCTILDELPPTDMFTKHAVCMVAANPRSSELVLSTPGGRARLDRRVRR